jgi:hypothetical protein
MPKSIIMAQQTPMEAGEVKNTGSKAAFRTNAMPGKMKGKKGKMNKKMKKK